MTTTEKPLKLSARQMALLERVCLKRYTVIFDHYMGSFQPNESIRVQEEGVLTDRTFRPATAAKLHKLGLLRFVRDGQSSSILKPTREGLALFAAERAKRSIT